MAAQKAVEVDAPPKQWRRVLLKFDGHSIASVVECSRWNNLPELVSSGYLSSDYREYDPEA